MSIARKRTNRFAERRDSFKVPLSPTDEESKHSPTTKVFHACIFSREEKRQFLITRSIPRHFVILLYNPNTVGPVRGSKSKSRLNHDPLLSNASVSITLSQLWTLYRAHNGTHVRVFELPDCHRLSETRGFNVTCMAVVMGISIVPKRSVMLYYKDTDNTLQIGIQIQSNIQIRLIRLVHGANSRELSSIKLEYHSHTFDHWSQLTHV